MSPYLGVSCLVFSALRCGGAGGRGPAVSGAPEEGLAWLAGLSRSSC